MARPSINALTRLAVGLVREAENAREITLSIPRAMVRRLYDEGVGINEVGKIEGGGFMLVATVRVVLSLDDEYRATALYSNGERPLKIPLDCFELMLAEAGISRL